jgi:Ala-tRNA(Pro) deacylase
MSIAPRVQNYLAEHQSGYEVLEHRRTASSLETAQAARVPAEGLAKAVLVKHEAGYALAVVPASRHIVISRLGKALHHRPLELASEAEMPRLFGDCEPGALPPLGAAYGLPTIVDEALDAQPEVYFEAGDHEHLVHMAQGEFFGLTSDAPRASFSRRD